MQPPQVPNFPVRPGDPGYKQRMPAPAPDPQPAQMRVLEALAPSPTNGNAGNHSITVPDDNASGAPVTGWTAPAQQRVVVSWGKDSDTVVVGIEVAPDWEMEDDPIVVPLDALTAMMPILRGLVKVKNLTGTKL